MTDGLPRTTPRQAGVDARGALAFLDAVEAAPDIQLHSMMLLRRGEVLAEGWWAPYRADRLHLLYSLSKSFTSTACGLAVSEGLLDLDDLVVDFFPQHDDVAQHPWTRALTVRNLAAMATGHHLDTLERARQAGNGSIVRGFLSLPPDVEPGSVFCYNNGATYTLGIIVQRVTGQTLTDYLRPRVFDPLGITRTYWDRWTDEGEIGLSGLYATTSTIAKLAELYRSGGLWQGTRILPAAWVAEATRCQTPNPDEPNIDWQQGYGFQFWMARHGYRGDGAYGQFAIVLPEQQAVIALTAETENMQGVLDLVWTHLLPAYAGGGSADADTALADRLARAALPAYDPAHPYADDPERSADAWVRALGVDDDPAGGWQLRLVDAEREFSVAVGNTARRHTEVADGHGGTLAVEAMGGWSDPDTFRAELVLLETAHRVEVVLSATGSHATWRSVPLRATSLLGLATR